MEALKVCVYWLAFFLLSWLFYLAFDRIISFAGLPEGFRVGISVVMSIATGYLTVELIFQPYAERKKYFTSIFVRCWFLAAMSCLPTILLHLFLLPFNLAEQAHAYWLAEGALFINVPLMVAANMLLERRRG